MLCLNSGSASFKGPDLCGLRRQVLRRDLVDCVNRCQMGRSSLWSISWLRPVMFFTHVTISATQAHKSDNLRHAMSPFSPFLSSFLGMQRILGYVRPQRMVAVRPPKRGKRRSIWRSLQIGTALTRHGDMICLRMQPPKDADSELRHSN